MQNILRITVKLSQSKQLLIRIQYIHFVHIVNIFVHSVNIYLLVLLIMLRANFH